MKMGWLYDDKNMMPITTSVYSDLMTLIDEKLREHRAVDENGKYLPDTEDAYEAVCNALLVVYMTNMSSTFGSDVAAVRGLRMFGLCLGGTIQENLRAASRK